MWRNFVDATYDALEFGRYIFPYWLAAVILFFALATLYNEFIARI